MADQIFSGDRLLIKGFPLNLLTVSFLTVSLMCIAAASKGQAISSYQPQSMSPHPTGRGLDARLWRSEFGSHDLHNEGHKKSAVEDKSAIPQEASDSSGVSSEKKTSSEPPLRHESRAPIKRQQEPTLQTESPGEREAAPGSEKNSRQQSHRKAVTEEDPASEETEELSPHDPDSGTIDKKQKAMESMVERGGLSSGQTPELSDVVAFEKLSPTETKKIKPPHSKPESDAILLPELSLETVTTAITMNDVASSESVQIDEVCEADGSAVQASIVTVSDWDRAAADSMRSSLSTGANGPSLTTYLVGIAALIVVGGAVLSPR